jgi:two-component system sensor histidine kinase ChiS
MFLFTIPKEVKVHSTYAYLIGLVFSVLFSSLFFTLHAQKLVRNNNYLFENYSAEDGLSFIYDIVQDREGYLWVGTQTGLLKYDGYQFNMVLPPADNDKTKFIEGIAWIIEEDSEGFIWMLSNLLTISKIDPNTGVFRIYAPQVDSNLVLLNRGVTAIMPDSAYQGVWVGTRQGLLLLQDKFYPSEGPPVVTAFPFANFTTSPDTVNGQYISQLYRDEEGSLWIGTNRGFSKLLQADPDKGQIQLKHYVRTPGDSSGLGINYISLLSPAKEGSFWVLGGRINSNNNYSAHMQHFNPFTEEFKDVEFSLPGQVSISTLLEDQSANIWLGTIGKGLHKRSLRKESDNEVGKELSFDFDLDVAGIDNQNRVHNLIIGHDGNIWFSTFTGLYKFSPSKNSFQFFDLPDLKSQNIPYVLSFATDRNGQIWIGSSGGGLFRFDPERDSIFSVPQLGGVPIPEQNIISVYADSLNNLWLSTMKGIFRFDLIKQKMVFFSDASKKLEGIAWPNQIFEDNSGRIWFPTTGRGLLVLDPVSENYQHYLPISGDSNSLASYKVWQVFQDSKGGLWTATLDGLQQIIPKGDDPSKFQFKSVSSLNGKELLWLHEDQKGRFWVSTFMEGLYLLDSTKNILKQYYRKDGLSGVVNSIFEDQTGILWLSGGLGIVRFDPEKETFTSYGPEQGIRFAPYGRMGFQTQEGKILFSAGNDGFYRFDPATFNTNAVPPKVHITEIRLFEQPLVPGGNPYLTEAIDSQTVLRLPYDQNSLTFSFVGLHFDHPEKNEYSFTLEGHEQEWSSAGSERSARYSNLPPGDYSFRVKASNSDGLWNEIGAKIRVIIRPPWWQTLWAKTIYAISFLGLLFGLYRWRSAVQRRKIRQMEKDLAQEQSVSTRLRQVDQLKDQFLANTSHELRTPLHGMIGLSESIIEKTEDPEQKEDLSMIIFFW